MQHLGHNELVGVELPPNLGHAVHQGAVDDFQRRSFLERLIQVFGQPFLGAFDDGEGQTLVQRQIAALFIGGCRGLFPEVGRESRDRVFAAIPDQVFRQLALLFGDGGIAHHQLRVDDGHVQSGLNAVVQEHGVKHLTAGGRQPERNVGDTEDRLAVR